MEERGVDAVIPVGATFELLSRSAALYPDRTAITLLPNGRADDAPQRTTYRTLLDRVIRCANGLRAMGVNADDTVAYLLPTLPDTFVTLFGAQLAGARLSRSILF